MKINAFSRKRLFMKLLAALARQDRARLAAFVLRRRIKELSGTGQKENGAFKILALQKGGFNQDIEAALASRPQVRLFSAPRTDFQAFFSAFLPDNVRDYSYIGHPPEIEAAKLRYRDFLNRLWTELEQRGLRFDAVVSGNHVYYGERELATMVEARGTPFVVVHKEGLKAPANAEFFMRQYRKHVGPFTGRKTLVYNETERDIQIRGGIVPPERVAVVGMARMDRYHVWRKTNANVPLASKRRMIFFWFNEKTGIIRPAALSASGNQESWSQVWTSVISELRPLAQRHSDLQILIKAKGMANGAAEIRRQLSAFGAIPPNIEIKVGGDPFEQILAADFAVGLISTALFEVIAAGKPLLVPHFAEAAKPEMQEFLTDFGGAADYALSREEFVQKLNNLASATRKNIVWNSDREALLAKWFGNPDGHAGDRIWQSLLKELKPK